MVNMIQGKLTISADRIYIAYYPRGQRQLSPLYEVKPQPHGDTYQRSP